MLSLITAYPALKTLHISLALLSGLFFAIRGTAVLAGKRWPLAPPARRLSITIDSLLLASALGLLLALHGAPLTQAWLHGKLALLLAYIVCGALALKRAPTLRSQGLAFAAALLCFAALLAVALSHTRWGAG